MVSILPLTLTSATVHRHGRDILGPVDLSIDAGGALVVLGPNGAGKTTLLKSCHGIMRLSDGHAEWAVPRAQADLAQAYVFQTPILLRRSAFENVIYPLALRKVSKAEARTRAEAVLGDVGLLDLADQPAGAMSGGERQKLAIARALVTKPEVLFLDEPTASLDGRATREIEAILSRAMAAGTKLIMSTHNLGQARRIASDVVFVLNGRIHEAGPALAFFAGPQTSEAAAFLEGDIVE
ncbi:MAG: ATP-binding cassette domain-containing protein [Boseongicola sp.]|nr:MAG: ATP-binding cassette domain-containing protein [Boseongicola sp.]